MGGKRSNNPRQVHTDMTHGKIPIYKKIMADETIYIRVYESARKLWRMKLYSSECLNLCQKMYKILVVKKYLANLARARTAAIGNSG